MGDYRYQETEGSEGAPLVFTFHGTGGGPDQFHGFARQLWPGAHVISPAGDVSEMGAARYFRRTGEGVYDMDDLARRTAAMADFVAGHRARLGAERVIGLGYSNGANILASVLFDRPELFEEAALLHPLIPWQPDLGDRLQGKRILVTAGKADPICPAPLTESLIATLRAAGADLHTHWHRSGHEIAQGEIDALAAFAR
ncbi:alpha/beta hydrolase [Roseobacter sp. HKCCA0434]|uniref:alpha/beta hydrolase n=1 Tax=Roseobacter sp. HKCCA0434 TaxID=3079297 RepID=UPI002905CF02|nr:alpha/beta hydrolase [Roseobacter sp. HKCCA0434]